MAGDRRLLGLMDILARRHTVHFFGYWGNNPEELSARDALRRMGVIVHGKGWRGFVAATLTTPFDLAVFEFFHSFEMWGAKFRQRQPGAALVIDSVDVHFAREAAAASLGLVDEHQVADTRTRELAAYRAVDAVIAVTDEDAQLLRAEEDLPPVSVLPMVVPLATRSARARRPNALFVGGFKHQPNVDGVQWFVSEIWPLVREAVPDATFRIAGSQMPSSIQALSDRPGVEVLGDVPDTAPYLEEAQVSVAPLRFGAGMKGKVNEAMAAGVPVVSTSYGVQGLSVTSGVEAIVADEPKAFADALIFLFGNPAAAETIGGAGHKLAQRFSPEHVAQQAYALCDQLVAGRAGLGVRAGWLAAQFRVAGNVAVRKIRHALGR